MKNPNSIMKLNGLLISSGFSSRMGDFKPLLIYQEVPFFINILIKLLQICDGVTLVLGHKQEEIKSVFNKFKIDKKLVSSFCSKLKLDENLVDFNNVNLVINSNFEKGMFTSLQTGLKHISNGYVIYHFVDQPHIPLNFYNKIKIQDFQNYDWFQPQFRGRNGHPIILSNKVKNIILEASENSNLRDVLKIDGINKGYWGCDFPQILDDIDTPKDYQGLC